MKMLLAFDLYGTLLSTASISKAVAAEYGAEKADSIATLWRRYQIEYTFRLNSMSKICLPDIAQRSLMNNRTIPAL